jgi:glucarate dehydratase
VTNDGGRIGRIRLWRVRVPLEMVYVSSMYVMTETTRTVIELETADGSVRGLGEAHGSEDVFRLVGGLAREVLGTDPADRRAFERRFARSVFDNRNGRSGWSAAAGVELAMWDLVGRKVGLPLGALLGGAERGPVELVCPVPAVILDAPVGRAELETRFADRAGVDGVAHYAVDQAARLGFRSFKYKSAAARPDFDLAVMTALREALPAAQLRFDPNAGYPPAEAIALCRRLEPLGLEFYEDPTDDQEGLARLRAEVTTPVATNMAVIQIDQLAAAIRRRPVDVILADLFLWGGPLRFRGLVHCASAVGFEVAIHSLFETGIGTAANLHLAAAFGEIRRANDSGLHGLARDVTVAGPLRIEDGAMTVPWTAGLGVELDRDAVRDLAIEERELVS